MQVDLYYGSFLGDIYVSVPSYEKQSFFMIWILLLPMPGGQLDVKSIQGK